MSPGLLLKEGSEVEHDDRRFIIMQVVGFDAVVARDVETSDLERLSIAELRPVRAAVVGTPPPQSSEPNDSAWKEARRRLDLIAPLLDGSRPPRSAVADRARTGGVDVTTLYRWARAYRSSGLSSLLPYKPAGGRGKSRLTPAVEQILSRTIDEHFAKQRSISATAAEVARRCREAQLPAPNINTVRTRITALSMNEAVSPHSEREDAPIGDRLMSRPNVDAERLLDLNEIDYAKPDILVVDEQEHLKIASSQFEIGISRKEALDQLAPLPLSFDDAQRPLDLVPVDNVTLDIFVVPDEQLRLTRRNAEKEETLDSLTPLPNSVDDAERSLDLIQIDDAELDVFVADKKPRLPAEERRNHDHERQSLPYDSDDALRPLELLQIDHTQLDIVVVDDRQRLIGRPWITVAIDVFSRMVTGFYISLDPPGPVSTGLCIAHAISPKETWLATRNVVGEWPCYGPPRRINLDEANGCHGTVLLSACEQYGINLKYRSVVQSHLGSHIKRLLGTLLRALQELPAAMFSSSGSPYALDASAVMTLGEVEQWLTEYIIDVYHLKRHPELETSPLQRWMAGAFSGEQSTAMIQRPTDAERIQLDFMPYAKRTVGPLGVAIYGIHYYGQVLRRFFGTTDVQSKRTFLFRRDPRDISTVYFWDPELLCYHAIPYRNTTRPPVSIWKLRELRRTLRQLSSPRVDEHAIFELYARSRER